MVILVTLFRHQESPLTHERIVQAFHTFKLMNVATDFLIRSDNMSVVSYINHQGGVSSKRLFILAERLLE